MIDFLEKRYLYGPSTDSEGGKQEELPIAVGLKILQVDGKFLLEVIKMIIEGIQPTVVFTQYTSAESALIGINKAFSEAQPGEIPFDRALIASGFTGRRKDKMDGIDVVDKLKKTGMDSRKIALISVQDFVADIASERGVRFISRSTNGDDITSFLSGDK